ncbi:hypothetical protein ABBQ38_012247 [Trebouxia sp. C0009 RCD-2024]
MNILPSQKKKQKKKKKVQINSTQAVKAISLKVGTIKASCMYRHASTSIDFDDVDIGSSPEHVLEACRPRKPETETQLLRETVHAVKGTADVKGPTQDFRKLALQAQQNNGNGGHRPAHNTNIPECQKFGRKGHLSRDCKVQPPRQNSLRDSSHRTSTKRTLTTFRSTGMLSIFSSQAIGLSDFLRTGSLSALMQTGNEDLQKAGNASPRGNPHKTLKQALLGKPHL